MPICHFRDAPHIGWGISCRKPLSRGGIMTSLLKTLVVRDPASDAQLLGRFVRDRDDAAFTELVRRHGPLVLGVCRRVIPDRHLADDAFQAAFVVLARKAESVQPDKLASWLYGVSYKVALRARTMAGRRAKHETLTATLPETPVPPDPVDDGILDAEIANLPALYRDAVVLCELQGVSRHDAAKTLGILEGTLSSRLANARKLLAVALARRGVTMPATLAVTTTVTLELCTATVRAATGTLAPPLVTTLANGVLRTMLLSQLKLTAIIGVCAAMLLSLGIGSITRPEVAIAAPVPLEAKDEGLIWLHHRKSGLLTAYTPDGKKAKEFTLKDGRRFLGITPDGQKIAFQGKEGKLPAENEKTGLTVHLRDVNDETVGEDTGFSLNDGDVIIWSPDRQQVVRWRSADVDNQIVHMHVLFDLASKKETKIELPANHYMLQWPADGKTWQLHEYVRADLRDANLPRYRMMSVPVGGGKPTPLCDSASLLWLEATGDGQTSFGFGHGHTNPANENEDATYRRWFRLNAKGEATLVKTFDEFDGIELRLAPNRQRVVCLGQTSTHDKPGNSTLLLYDPDGKNERKLVTIPHEGKQTTLLGWYPAKVAAKRIEPVPKAEPDMGLLWLHDTKAKKLIAKSPDGRLHQEIDLPEGDRFLGFTADGTKILFAGKGGKVADSNVTEGLTLHLRDDFVKPEGTDTGLGYQTNDQFVLSPDGKQIVRQRLDKVGVRGAKHEYAHVLFDVVTKKETKIDLPDDHLMSQWSADGKTWRVVKNLTIPYKWFSTPVGGGKLTPISGADSYFWLDLSHDGKTFLAVGDKALFHLDTANGKATEIAAFENADVLARWSPDDRHIGCIKYDSDPANTQIRDSHLLILDADGKNEKTLLTFKDGRKTEFLGWYPAKVAAKHIAPAPQPAVVEPGVIWTYNYKTGLLTSYTPDGKRLKALTLKDGKHFRRMTPDGQKIVFIGRNGRLAEEGAKDGTLHIRDVNHFTEGEDLGIGYQEGDTIEWSPDRKQILRERHQFVGEGAGFETSSVLFDVATKKETSFDSAGFRMSQWLDDGKLYFYEAIRDDPRYPTLPRLRKWKMSFVGGKPTILCENASLWWLASVGDDSYIGLGRLHENPKNESEYVVYRRWLRINAKGEASVVKTFDEFEHVGLKLSPDRKQVACMGQTRGTDPDRTGSSTLLLYDLDGKNERKILTLPNDDKQTQMLGWFPAAK